MAKIIGPLDRLPAWLRHAIIIFGGALFGHILQKIFNSGGVTSVDWPDELRAALNAAMIATGTALSALWTLPITTQYGPTWQKRDVVNND